MKPVLACGLTTVVLSSGGVIACRSSSSRVPPTTATTTLTGAELGSSSNDDAVMRVATARCERELACNKIGRGRAYEDQPTCLERMGALMDEEAGKDACPAGVDPFALSSCLFDIEHTACGGELERQTNIPTCKKASLCRR